MQDCDAANKEKILAELDKYKVSRVDIFREYTFNRFTLSVDFKKQEVTIVDDLDISEEGACRYSINEFVAALQQYRPEG
jgi:hypothetical protein